MKIETTFPPELVDAIAEAVVQRIKPMMATTGTVPDAIMDVKGLAAYLGIREQRVYEAANLGTIPYFKVGKYLRFKRSTVDRWIESQAVPASRPLRVVK